MEDDCRGSDVAEAGRLDSELLRVPYVEADNGSHRWAGSRNTDAEVEEDSSSVEEADDGDDMFHEVAPVDVVAPQWVDRERILVRRSK